MALITLIWFSCSILVNPQGNFPLGDDWSYGLAVKRLVENGEFRPTGWQSIPLASNILWGSLFCLPAGFSFTWLRLSTLLLSLFGVWGTYVLIKDLRQLRWLAMLGALTLAFNPLYFSLSYSFMTDAQCTALMVLAVVSFARNLELTSDSQLIIGTALSLAATLSRQVALSIPIAFGVASLLRRGLSGHTMLRAAIPSLTCVIGLLALKRFMVVTGTLPALYSARTKDIFDALANSDWLLGTIVHNSFIELIYLGLFLLPLLLVHATSILPLRGKTAVVIFGIAMVTMATGAIARRLHGNSVLMPLSHNVLIKSGIGPLTLRDTSLLHLDHMPALPDSFWIVVTGFGLVGGALLILTLLLLIFDLTLAFLKNREFTDNDAVSLFLLLSMVVYLAPLFGTFLFDRYLVPVVPLLGGLIASRFESSPASQFAKGLRITAFALVAALAYFATCTTHDYLSWNRARWTALRELTQSGRTDPAEVDGGFEFNGLHFYDPHYHGDALRSWWWVQRDTYQIGFGSVPGYKVIGAYTYLNWLPLHVQRIVVLKKETDDLGKAPEQ